MQTSNNITIIDKVIAATLLKLLPAWITPNHITIFRFLTIPFIIFLLVVEQHTIGVILFVLSASSDALDGALARTTNQITDWGKMFDPLADKLLIGSVAVVLIPKFLNPYLALVIIIIELFLILNAYYKKHYLGATIEAKKAGKVKMIFQSLGIGALFIYILAPIPALLALASYSLYASIAFALVSLIVYKSI